MDETTRYPCGCYITLADDDTIVDAGFCQEHEWAKSDKKNIVQVAGEVLALQLGPPFSKTVRRVT